MFFSANYVSCFSEASILIYNILLIGEFCFTPILQKADLPCPCERTTSSIDFNFCQLEKEGVVMHVESQRLPEKR